MRVTMSITIVFAMLVWLTGCGTDIKYEKPVSLKSPVGQSEYLLQADVTTTEHTESKLLIIQGNAAQVMSAFVLEHNSSNAAVAEATATSYATMLQLRSVAVDIEALDDIALVSTINEQTLVNYTEFTVGDFAIITNSPMYTSELVELILGKFGVTGLALPSAGDAGLSVSFRMMLSVAAYNGQHYYIAAVTPYAEFDANSAMMTMLTSGSNMTGAIEVLRADTTDHDGRADSNNADFLFVIDDSGSMGENQEAVQSAAEDFGSAITASGMDHQIAIITTGEGAEDSSSCTDGCYDQVIKDIGIIDNNLTLFKEKVVIGTDGSPTETGIFNAESSLMQLANGDKKDGLLKPYHFPRETNSVSVIIISDEVSQYESRANGSFNPKKNLFVDNGYFVHALVDIGQCGDSSFYSGDADPNGQYDELATATGGLTGNICREVDGVPNFSAIMQNIVYQAAGAYRLKYADAKPNSIVVTVNGSKVPVSTQNGYLFIEASNSIAFFGSAKPEEGDTISIYYEFPRDAKLFANE